MKRSGKRLLAVLLCLAMAMTLLPVSALARWDDAATPETPAEQDERATAKAELPVDAEGGDDKAELSAKTITPDGAVTDGWAQDTQTIRGEDSVCEVKDGKLHLKVGSGNENNGNAWTGADSGTGPAVFISDTMKNALQVDADGNYNISFKVKPLVSGICFGVYFNYTNPANAALAGFNTPGNWFWQSYYPKNDGTTEGDDYGNPSSAGPTLTANTTYEVQLSWNPANKTYTYKMGAEGETLTTVFNAVSYSAVTNAPGGDVVNNIGIKLGKSNAGVLSEIEVWDLHYTGQASVNVYNVTGTVTDGTNGLADVEVTASAAGGSTYTATTDAQGSYTLEDVVAGTYTLTFKKDGYGNETGSVTVSTADVTAAEVTMAKTDAILIETDGVNNGDWTQIASTKVTGSVDPTVVNGELVLTAGYTNGHKMGNVNPKTAIFTSAKMTQALGTVSGERTISFTLTPECGKDENKSNVTDYIAFGIALNVSGDNNGYGISYSSEDTGDANKWLVQQFNNGVGAGYNTTATLLPEVGKPMKFEITWTDTTVTIKIDDQELSHGVAMGNVARSNTVAFTVGGKDYNDDQLQNEHRPTRIRISNLHYSGQETIAARYVSGTVTSGTEAVVGAKVSVAGAGNEAYKAVTDATGAYQLAVPISDTAYTLQAAKDGYVTGSQTVAVTATADKDTLSAVNFTLTKLPTISGKVVDKNNKGVLGATVVSDKRPEGASTTTKEDGTFEVIGAVNGEHTLTVSAEGYETKTVKVTVNGANVSITPDIVLEDRKIPSYTLSTADMDVTVAQAFPQVIQYTLKGDLAGKTMYGQTAELDTVKINGKDVKPTVTSVPSGDNTKVTYTMVIDDSNNNGTGVTATITAELRVGLADVNDKQSDAAGRTLGFYITGVTYPNNDRLTHPLDTIEIPNHSLVSVRSTEAGAAVTGAKLAANSVTSGDTTYEASKNVSESYNGYTESFFAAFVYNNDLSAGLSSNSAYGGGTAGSQTYPVKLQFDAKDGGATMSLGLGSTLWYYDHDITQNEAKGYQALTDEELPAAKRVIAPLDMPYAKVVITGDMNGSKTVDWQDGAIAYRETVMHIPVGGEQVANTANLRISMNFGSMATNPFLIALENVKRVSAHTDGLGQFVLLKGYAGEGHDSNHPQYDNIGIRMGGPDDLKTLLEEGEKLGAAFGIHVNASEFYAEAITNESQVLRSSSSMKYGWNWLDQGISINAVYDYASGLRKARWDKLYEIVKGHPFTVYVDVWGNNTSGAEDDFQTRALSNEITSYPNWRIAHEWSWANPYESTFQHWTTDYTYGNYSDKGKLNSNVIRFLLNQYKDSFPADFATFGGACNAPLLGGPAMQGFEGWQQDGEYNLSIYNTFNQMIYTKFLQHYSVTEWTNASKAVKMAYSEGANGARSNEKDWVPEVQLKLAGGGDEIVVTRGTTGEIMTDATLTAMGTAEGFLNNETEYRSRVVTLNGKIIVTGAPASAGEDGAFPASKATLKYLIPWYWKVDGERVAAADEKLYHWNAQGGESTWELPKGWENLATVIVYELSDQGRGTGKSVKVTNGKVTLTATANTCYVVTKGATAKNAPVIEYGVGLHLGDPSFNLDTARSDNPWTVTGKGSAVHTTNTEGIGVLKMIGEVSVSQTMTDLKPGTNYVSYVAVDNRSNAKASMTITDNTGKVVATNYTTRSIAKNYVSSYYLHNNHGVEAGGSYFQNMFLYFTPEAGKTYTMTLSREAGAGNVYFDDLRTVEYGFNYSGFGAGQTAQRVKGSAKLPVTYDPKTGAATSLTQDFENVPQGIWPFVVGPVEGVNDNRTHVSELNVPFTQAGWDVKKLDDVIDGNWSIKSNGLSGRNSLVYQTIPQNFRFEPGNVYTVGFDYELGSTNSYVAVVGDGAYTGLDGLTVYNLEKTLKTTVPATPDKTGTTVKGNVNKADVGHIEFTVVGSDSGQTWIGIYSKENADNQGTSGSAAAFGGYTDFVLDNLTIKLAPPEKNELALLLRDADAMEDPSIYSAKTGTDADAWSALETARENGHTVFDNDSATTAQVTAAVDALKAAIGNLEKVAISISGKVTNTQSKAVEGVVLTLEDATYMPVGLTVTTGADGTYKFESKSGVELLPGTYHIKAQCTGYNVTTTDGITLSKENSTKTQDISLEAEAPGAYVNDFNNGDISMMGHLEPPEGTEVSDSLWPTLEAVEFNGTGALKVTFNADSGVTHNTDGVDCRNINNVIDTTVPFANGSYSFDVTPLTTGRRFGVTLRAGEMNHRVCIGQQDAPGAWMGEFWDTSKDPSVNEYTATTGGKISVDVGATRNVRVVVNDKSFQVFIDGDSVYNLTMNNVQTGVGYAGINFRGYYVKPGNIWTSIVGSEFIIDNLRIISADTTAGVYNVSGTVTGSNGEVISGAAVELYKGETRITGTATNALGVYQVTGVVPDTYTVKVTAPFFVETEEEITVSADLTGKGFTLTLDKTSLTTLITDVEALNEEDYTEETWAELAKALTAAKGVANNDEATVAALNTAYRDLSNAKDALAINEKTAVDFSQLRALYNEKAVLQNAGYTTESWNALQAALSAASSVLGNGNATQEQIDDAKAAIQDAFDALATLEVEGVDIAGLQSAYNAAKDEVSDDYTPESWSGFEQALENAKVLLNSAADLTADDAAVIEAAIQALTDAQAALVKKSTADDNPTTTRPTTSNSTSTQTREDGAKVTTVTAPDGTVTQTVAQPDGTKSETVTTPEGDTTVTVTDPDGEELARVELPATIPEPETEFEDISVTPWAEEAINNMAGLKLVNGIGGNKYDPTTPMTRGSLATVLHRLSNGKTDYKATFKDVAANRYYTEGVAWAAKANVVKGISEDIFAPDQIITREQLAVMLARYAKLIGMSTKADAKSLEQFADGDSTGTWAVDGVAWCVEKGILKGKGQGNLDPTADVSRAEVAVMLDRFISLIK